MRKKMRTIIALGGMLTLILANLFLSPPSANAQALDPSLVGFWSFNDGTANDKTLNGYNGTPSGGALSRDKNVCAIGKCFELDGASGYIYVPTIPLPTTDFTYTIWVKLDVTNDEALFMVSDAAGGNELVIAVNGPVQVQTNNTPRVTSTTIVPAARWTFIAVTRAGATIQVYINGIAETVVGNDGGVLSFNCGLLVGTDNDAIGCGGAGALGNWLDGSVDEVKVYNRALSANEIADEYTASWAGGTCTTSENNCYALNNCSDDGFCVPATEIRTIGTWCNRADDCYTATVNFELSCDVDNNMCVGAASGIDCSTTVINTLPEYGTVSPPREDRCDEFLVCDLDNNQVGDCTQDFGKPYGEQLGLGGTSLDIRDQIRRIVNIVLGFLGIAGVIVVIYSGVMWLTSQGEEDKIEKAKKTLVAGLIGLVIIGIAWTIVSYILNVTAGLGVA